MKLEEFRQIADLDGIVFVQELLRIEERCFEQPVFVAGSTFEEINADFGVFPTTPAFPVYFAGEIRTPANKIVCLGNNPGYNADQYRRESAFLLDRGLFDGYCNLYRDYFKAVGKVQYYSKLGGFLSCLLGVSPKLIDWDWFQDHLITLELIPYHSTNANGLRINDPQKYRLAYFEILLKILRHLNPQTPTLINGFPTFRRLTANRHGILPEFSDVISYETFETVSIGRIDGHIFIGLPFLSQQTVGKARMVREIHDRLGPIDWPITP